VRYHDNRDGEQNPVTVVVSGLLGELREVRWLYKSAGSLLIVCSIPEVTILKLRFGSGLFKLS